MRTAQVVLGDPEISALASLRHSEIYVITAHCLAGSSLEGELLSPVVFKPKGDLRTRPLFLFHENRSNPHFQLIPYSQDIWTRICQSVTAPSNTHECFWEIIYNSKITTQPPSTPPTPPQHDND
jgi:hypothetical protein